MGLKRRQFLGLGVASLGGALATGVTFLNVNNEADEPVVDQVQIPLKNLPAALEGFTIAVLADFHLYPYTQLELIKRSVALANSINPDVTLLLGDYVWHEVEAVFDLAPALANLNAKHGVFSILGNHDLWTDVTVIKTALAQAGLPLLVNQGVTLAGGGASLYLAGLDDGWSGTPDLPGALDAAPTGAPVVLMAHEPDLADDFSLDGRVSLQVSGHSHGGQIRTAITGAFVKPYLSWKYDMGLYNVNNMWLYTNRGIGTTNVPMRVNCPPEVTQITLISG